MMKRNIITSDASVEGDSYTAIRVESDCSDFACASRAVLVVPIVSRHRVVIVVVDI